MSNWKYFEYEEFACSCCGDNLMSKDFIDDLNTARTMSEVPFKINSGYRCPKHEESIKNPTSSHIRGIAVDILANTSHKKYEILSALLRMGFNRIGISENFIHVDTDQDKHQKVIWTYK